MCIFIFLVFQLCHLFSFSSNLFKKSLHSQRTVWRASIKSHLTFCPHYTTSYSSVVKKKKVMYPAATKNLTNFLNEWALQKAVETAHWLRTLPPCRSGCAGSRRGRVWCVKSWTKEMIYSESIAKGWRNFEGISWFLKIHLNLSP